MKRRRSFVCDIDGTASDARHRAHLVSGGRRDFEAFYKLQSKDPPIPATRTVVQALSEAGLFAIFLTARPGRFRTETGLWLARHGFTKGPHTLIMRPGNSLGSNAAFKREAYRDQIAPKFTVELWLEDQDSVVKMVREDLKLPCWQVQPGDY